LNSWGKKVGEPPKGFSRGPSPAFEEATRLSTARTVFILAKSTHSCSSCGMATVTMARTAVQYYYLLPQAQLVGSRIWGQSEERTPVRGRARAAGGSGGWGTGASGMRRGDGAEEAWRRRMRKEVGKAGGARAAVRRGRHRGHGGEVGEGPEGSGVARRRGRRCVR
jgi:hypothetical protein